MPEERNSPAIACTLATAHYKDRLAWIEKLNADALNDYRREGARIKLTYESSAEARVREFVRRERQCCPFLNFTIRRERDAAVLKVTAPEDASEAADALFATYTVTRRT